MIFLLIYIFDSPTVKRQKKKRWGETDEIESG